MADFQRAKDLFESARLKLTIYYFVVLAMFCVLLTVGVRAVTSYELRQGGSAERGEVREMLRDYYGNSQSALAYPQYLVNSQQRRDDEARQHIDRDLLLLDLLLLAGGAAVSYWYAGRTLKPIEEAHEQQ